MIPQVSDDHAAIAAEVRSQVIQQRDFLLLSSVRKW
jgi:hypothetical protein